MLMKISSHSCSLNKNVVWGCCVPYNVHILRKRIAMRVVNDKKYPTFPLEGQKLTYGCA